MKKWIILAVAILAFVAVLAWFLYVPAAWQKVVSRCTDYDPQWIGMLDCYGLIAIFQPDNSGYIIQDNAVPGSIIAQISSSNSFIVDGDQMYLMDITPVGGCANNKKGYCRDFQVDGKVSTISYDDPKQTPRYLVINTRTGDERFYVQPQDASSSDQAIFQELSVKQN
jgi:hypothetical protein